MRYTSGVTVVAEETFIFRKIRCIMDKLREALEELMNEDLQQMCERMIQAQELTL